MENPCHHSCPGGWWGNGEDRERDKFLMDNGSLPQAGLAVWPRASHCPPAGAEGSARAGVGAGRLAGRSTHHCRMLESMGLEKMRGEVLVTVGLGSNPSISRNKCALGGHPSKAIRAGTGPVHLCVLQPHCRGRPPHGVLTLSQAQASPEGSELVQKWGTNGVRARLTDTLVPHLPVSCLSRGTF